MRVIPVIDLKSGEVVRGVAGQRETYRAISSCVAQSAQPGIVAQSFVDHFNATVAYVADLDAIAGKTPDWESLGAIADAGLDLIVDAGISNLDSAKGLLRRRDDSVQVVIALETIEEPSVLQALVEAVGSQNILFSLDLKDGSLITNVSSWRSARPLDVVAEAVAAGFQRLIVLDLASVGVDQGPSVLPLCRAIHETYPHVELISGGGVRGEGDLRAFRDAGCDGVLVASALHDGRLTAKHFVTVA